MTKDVTTSSTRRTVIGGVAGMLLVALGGAAAMEYEPASARAAATAPALQPVVANAVSAAQEAHAAEVAAAQAAEAEAQAAAALLASQQQAVVDLASAQAGDRYRMGASGPDIFDCSGLVKYVYGQAMGVSLPHNTHAQWNAIGDTWYAGEREPRPGDVVFFFNNGADHVGLYIGNGLMVNAENPRSGVKVAPVYEGYWGSKLTGFGRIIH